MSSIRSKLVLWLIGALAVGSVLVLAATYALTREQVKRIFDEELRQVALAVHVREDWTDRRLRIARPGFALAVRAYDAAGKIYFETHGEFATPGAMTPAAFACAGTVSTKHVPNPALWAATPWVDLVFQMNDRHLYSYIYLSTATTMTAIAIGDLDCDGTPGSFSMAAANTAGEFEGGELTNTTPNE